VASVAAVGGRCSAVGGHLTSLLSAHSEYIDVVFWYFRVNLYHINRCPQEEVLAMPLPSSTVVKCAITS